MVSTPVSGAPPKGASYYEDHAEAQFDGMVIRLVIWRRRMDEFVVLTPTAARALGEDLVRKADELIARESGDAE